MYQASSFQKNGVKTRYEDKKVKFAQIKAISGKTLHQQQQFETTVEQQNLEPAESRNSNLALFLDTEKDRPLQSLNVPRFYATEVVTNLSIFTSLLVFSKMPIYFIIL